MIRRCALTSLPLGAVSLLLLDARKLKADCGVLAPTWESLLSRGPSVGTGAGQRKGERLGRNHKRGEGLSGPGAPGHPGAGGEGEGEGEGQPR